MTVDEAIDWLCATQQELQYLNAAAQDIPGWIADELKRQRQRIEELEARLSSLSSFRRVAEAETYHVWDFIEEELAARKWSLDMLAYLMGAKPGDKFDVHRLSLDLLKHARDERMTDMTVEGEMAAAFERAFGVSAAMFVNLHNHWRNWILSSAGEHSND